MGQILSCGAADRQIHSLPLQSQTHPRQLYEWCLEQAQKSLARSLKADPFGNLYKSGPIIGNGAFGHVITVQCRASLVTYAAKVMPKDSTISDQREAFIKEVAIMYLLQGHPNMVEVFDIFENPESFVIVMELCTGGELFGRIVKQGFLTEKEAAARTFELLNFLRLMELRGVVHRDLKPENLMLSSTTAAATLKVVDFGTADVCMSGDVLTEKYGTPFYVAPEVLDECYGTAADVWSAGVILYVMLSGCPPFDGSDDSAILEKVKAGRFEFTDNRWRDVSDDAKDVICSVLATDPTVRSSPQELMNHRWFETFCDPPTAILGTHMLKRLCAFAAMNMLKRIALVSVAHCLSDMDIHKLQEVFFAMDYNHDGCLDKQELRFALAQVQAAAGDAELDALFSTKGIHGKDSITYEEFIAAMMDYTRIVRQSKPFLRMLPSSSP